jgi:hypothetical protein
MMANATIAASKAPVAILSANTPRDRITLNAVAGWRSASLMTRRCNVSVIGRRGGGATAARRGDGGGRKGVRRAGTTARECRITETNCPAKVRLPPADHFRRRRLAGNRRAHGPPQGDYGVNAHAIPSQTKAIESPPRK